jgi:Ras family.
MTKTYFRRADGVILLYDVTSERSFMNVRQWIQNIDVSKTFIIVSSYTHLAQ